MNKKIRSFRFDDYHFHLLSLLSSEYDLSLTAALYMALEVAYSEYGEISDPLGDFLSDVRGGG